MRDATCGRRSSGTTIWKWEESTISRRERGVGLVIHPKIHILADQLPLSAKDMWILVIDILVTYLSESATPILPQNH